MNKPIIKIGQGITVGSLCTRLPSLEVGLKGKLRANINTFDSTRINWIGKNDGYVEASSLGLKAGTVPYCPLYDDSRDVGLILFNPKKGTKYLFVLEREMDNDDGDIVYWKFKSIDGVIDLTILND